MFIWRSPHGWIYRVDHHGTHPLGNTPYAHATWNAADQLQAMADQTAERAAS